MEKTRVPTADVESRVLELVAEEAEVARETVDRDTTLGAGGLFDSLGVVELIMALEDEFELSIPDAEAEKILTVGQLIDAISARLQQGPQGTRDGIAPPSQ